jgi:hypothetical protein
MEAVVSTAVIKVRDYARIGMVDGEPRVLELVAAPIRGDITAVTVRVSRAICARIRAGETSCAALRIQVVVSDGRVVRATVPGRGQPARAGVASSETIRYRVTPADFTRAAEIAKARGQSVHDFARGLLERELAL